MGEQSFWTHYRNDDRGGAGEAGTVLPKLGQKEPQGGGDAELSLLERKHRLDSDTFFSFNCHNTRGPQQQERYQSKTHDPTATFLHPLKLDTCNQKSALKLYVKK